MIPTFGNTASVSEVVAALRSSGAAIVTSAASSELMQIVAAELRSGFDECALEEQSAFDGVGPTGSIRCSGHHPAQQSLLSMSGWWLLLTKYCSLTVLTTQWAA